MTALAERWWDTTNTFHFRFGEMTVTPLDFAAITGLRVGGEPIPFDPSIDLDDTALEWFLGRVHWDCWARVEADFLPRSREVTRSRVLLECPLGWQWYLGDRVTRQSLGSLEFIMPRPLPPRVQRTETYTRAELEQFTSQQPRNHQAILISRCTKPARMFGMSKPFTLSSWSNLGMLCCLQCHHGCSTARVQNLTISNVDDCTSNRHGNGSVGLWRLPHLTHVYSWSNKCSMFLLSYSQFGIRR
ncbi:hypothetical protein RHMOL_Rhmol11G0024000 [Rhododendron molle]|uniref:Uncharacterized protein n=1 Tax=Rhododendron molle TaxID=49168 RepID=A0ACC0LN31_RHOML|nr:hypothetical protein RHMOL_Rhmol11G0024000 [Rhododendron molle]